ncbi:hypothetical protein BCV69DRAFT_283681 [Microstroma glucosiphilum]|uniref:Aromatic amino acid beta-eliminating lyase/threonine aldolase domain-containing protein n=1 Tax=Pseudomicrostroma glucosiphilum TaxID=1684307 RepID=A0A316U5M7_9BASI|nr:hypothetical protein BCV69DRAFT_283681 [Pseudomicrostroma glucosiphilum]PWN20144.1 hypothetical protein BCV69DRAFT_283681 [Pseudomicrostroma glucosiphilum]
MPSSASYLGPTPASSTPRFKLPEVSGHRDVHDNDAKLLSISRDFRSDTLTIPTDSMMEAMKLASRGDDVYQEDETTTSFQASINALTGKEASLFVVSGTMSNQLALRSHLMQPPYSVLLDVRSHVNKYEAGGLAFHSGATSIALTPSNGKYLRWEEDVLPNLVEDDGDVHFAPTRVVSLENTLAGNIFPQEEILKISTGCKERGIILHLDGARLWNVAAQTGMSMEELCEPFDTVSLCLSKGLGAPVGSILIGPQSIIRKATHFRKLFGGGLRQTGPVVAAARVALEEHFYKLKGTHELAKWMEGELRELGVGMLQEVETNMLWLDPSPIGLSNAAINARLKALHPTPIKAGLPRVVIHHQTDPAAARELVEVIKEMKRERESGKRGEVVGNGEKKGTYGR